MMKLLGQINKSMIYSTIIGLSFHSTSCLAALAANGVDLQLQLAIDKAEAGHHTKEAAQLIDHGLKRYPNNPSLLLQKASVQADLLQYRAARLTLQDLKQVKPNYPQANKLIKFVNAEIAKEPKNELGIEQDNAYVEDLHSIWNYTSVHYYRLSDNGKFGGRINYVHRYGASAFQYMLEAFPQVNNNISVALSYAYANNTQQLLPTRQYSLEPFFVLPYGFETSIGMRDSKVLGQNIYTYTASLGKYVGNYFLWIRPYRYTPNASNYNEIGFTRFFDSKSNYVYAKIGAGRAPDIADFAPSNQIIQTSMRTAYLGGQKEVANNLFLKAQGGYIWQAYPSNLIRRIYDGYLGLTWVF